MIYPISQKTKTLIDEVRNFIKNELEPISEEVEKKEKIPENITDKMRNLGLFGLAIPEEYGGMGLNTLEECLVHEEFGKVNACFRIRFSANNGIGSQAILIDGTDEQKRKYLPKIASGEWTAAFALTEANAGSDALNIQTKAVKKGGTYFINGVKQFITHGDIADVITVIARTGEEKNSQGISAFIVERTFPGFSTSKVFQKMGLHGINTTEIIFEDCQVPIDNIIGGIEGKGFISAMKVLDKSRITIAASCMGTSQHCLELLISHFKKRGELSKISFDNQAIQWMLADIAISIYAGRQMVYHAAWCRDMKQKVTQQAAMAKIFCSEMVNRIAGTALRIFGEIGYIEGSPIERICRDMRIFRIFEGTSEILRAIIAKELLKK